MAEIPTGTGYALGAIADERARQTAKWGEQNLPDGTGASQKWMHPYSTVTAENAARLLRTITQEAARKGTCTWRDVLLEEVAEAFKESDPAKLREELVQVAAVAVQWIEHLDRTADGVQSMTVPDADPDTAYTGRLPMLSEEARGGGPDIFRDMGEAARRTLDAAAPSTPTPPRRAGLQDFIDAARAGHPIQWGPWPERTEEPDWTKMFGEWQSGFKIGTWATTDGEGALTDEEVAAQFGAIPVVPDPFGDESTPAEPADEEPDPHASCGPRRIGPHGVCSGTIPVVLTAEGAAYFENLLTAAEPSRAERIKAASDAVDRTERLYRKAVDVAGRLHQRALADLAAALDAPVAPTEGRHA